MLSRTADNLFWVSRYLERADFLSRLIEASSRIAALPKNYASAQDEWTSALIASPRVVLRASVEGSMFWPP